MCRFLFSGIFSESVTSSLRRSFHGVRFSMNNTTNITRQAAAMIVVRYGGSRPTTISVPRWNAIVKQVTNVELKT